MTPVQAEVRAAVLAQIKDNLPAVDRKLTSDDMSLTLMDLAERYAAACAPDGFPFLESVQHLVQEGQRLSAGQCAAVLNCARSTLNYKPQPKRHSLRPSTWWDNGEAAPWDEMDWMQSGGNVDEVAMTGHGIGYG